MLNKPTQALLLVALSGGADSVYLLLWLLNQGYNIQAVHCNFHLRGEESDRDEEFCRQLCERKGVKLHITHFDTKAYAAEKKVSIELAARQLRYDYFEKLRQEIAADYIAVAHHKDDQAETILNNIIRGTGVKGLCGMKPQNGRIIRPLLDISRKDIEDKLKEWGETFVVDSTNLEDDATRNKIRHNIIPLLKEINPQAVDNICRMAEHLSETAAIEEQHYEAQKALFEANKQEEICFTEGFLHYLLSPIGFNATQIKNILAALNQPETKVFTSKTHIVDICRKRLYVSENKSDTFEPFHDEEGNLHRRPQPGDRFQPKGLKGTKLVSDFLNDKKLSPPQKRNVIVVENNSGRIIRVEF